MELILVGISLALVIAFYFNHNPMSHSRRFMIRRFINWFPLGMSYAFLYMGRYNLNVAKNALGASLPIENFGVIFGAGTVVYGLSFLVNGPLVDRIGGKAGIIISALGASLANILLGVATYLFLHQRLPLNLTWTLGVLYALNMFFQSYGAVSIIKVKAYWFHVRERGIFGAIFGTLISFGVYFAFDFGQAIIEATKSHLTGPPTALHRTLQTLFAIDQSGMDATWLVFFIPGVILIFWALLDLWLIKDTPSEANFEDFDTHDASSGEMDREFTTGDLLRRIFTSPVLLTVALVEFTSGVLRNGIMQWYFIFAKEVPQIGAEYFLKHWGFVVCMTGILGGFAGGVISDKWFHSRRAPPAAIFNAIMFTALAGMSLLLFSSPFSVALCAVTVTCFVIGVHSLMSGTAAADFGGRKATATASGIVDGCVYLGSGLQSVCLGFLVTKSWLFWPVFLAPFAALGCYFALRMWRELPAATRRYLLQVEHVSIEISTPMEHLESSTTTIQAIESP